MTVFWTNAALDPLLALRDFLSTTSTAYAERTVDRLLRRGDQIADVPRSGRMVPEYGQADVREVVERPYRILYRIGPERIEVLAVLHGARPLPATL